jgi:queuosine precursor transporter
MSQPTLTNHFSNKDLSAATRIYILLVSIFLGVLLVTNAITAKYIRIAQVTLTAGAITYPFTFTLLDIIAEVYGSKRAKWAVWMGLIASLLMTLVVQLAILAPAYSQSTVSQQAFQLLFGFTPGILFGSMVAYLIAQLADIYLFGWARRLTQGKYLWFRNVASTLISQLLDTLIFGCIAWILWPLLTENKAITPLPWDTWYQLTFNEYLFKVTFTLCSVPLVYLGVNVIGRWIKI